MTSSSMPIEIINRTLRDHNPLVHCLTNSVVQEISANVLLAVGASPAMVSHPEESGQFAAVADALLINVGNPDPYYVESMRSAVKVATAHGTPWVLDPVAVGGLTVRTELAVELLTSKPTVIRGNPSEILNLHAAFTQQERSGGRGVDSTDSAEAALDAAIALARETGGVVALSGATDIIVSDHRVTRISGGSAFMPLVIGTGCSLGAVVAAYLAAWDDAHEAAAAAHATFATAAEYAHPLAKGPGTFREAWLDGLHLAERCTASCETEVL